jgi:hypothetical protein
MYNLKPCDFHSPQFDESTETADTAMLAGIGNMVFSDNSMKEEILTILPLKGRTKGEDIYHAFEEYDSDINVPLQNLVSITTDGAYAMVDSRTGFVCICRKDESMPVSIAYRCVIHQEDLCTKVVNFKHVINLITKG